MSLFRFPLLFAVAFLFTTQSVWAVNPAVTLTTYYANADGKKGDALRTALGTIIASNKSSGTAHKVVSYDDIGYLLKYADTQNANGTNLIDIYTPCTFTVSGNKITWSGSCSGKTNVGCGLNREHTVPQSWFSSASPMVSDAFHVYATDAASNGHRGDYYYGETSSGTSYTGSNCNEYGKLGASKWTSANGISYTVNGTTYTNTGTYSGTVYEPADEYKGDIARGFFYMATRYASACSSWGNMFGSVNGLTQYTVDLMLKWHREDPVSEKELIRNEVIYGNTTYNSTSYYQGNRNPYIDYPCLVEYIWGSLKDQNVSLSSLTSAYDGSGSGCPGGGGTTTNYTITWMVNGSTWATTTSSGSSVGSLPSAPTSTSCGGKVFVGWTTATISGSTNTKPTTLFTDASGAPTITGDITFYAVFATASSGSGSNTITFTPGTDTGETSITKSGVTCTMSTMNNSSYYQIYASASGSFTCSTGNITGISFTCTASGTTKYGPGNASADVGTYSYSGSTGSWSGSASSVTISSTAQVRMSALSVTVSGGTSYSGYVTSCTACTPTNPTASFNNPTTSVYVGASVTYTVTTNSDGAVTYSSSNTSVATVDASTGQVTGVAAGSATITASIAASTCYNAKTATYTITVSAAPTYTITWSVDGTTTSETYLEGATLSVPTVNNCTGGTRVFKGWTTNSNYTSNDGSGLVTPTSPVAGNATYYAVYADATTSGSGGVSTDFELFSGTLVEGDYVIYYATNGYALRNEIASNRFKADTIAPTNNVFSNPNTRSVWHIAPSGNYWTIYNAALSKYAGGTSTKNQGALLDDASTDYALWTCSSTSSSTTYDFENKGRAAGDNPGNKYLRNNVKSDGTINYGFACYASSTGGALTLYKRASGGGTTTTYDNYSTHCSAAPTTYTITWKDGDGNTLKTEEVAAGSTPSYTGTTPTKTATAQYTYTFNNTWSPSIVSVTEPATYTAQFSSTLRQYNILWKNEDGTSTLETDANQNYGTATAFNGSTPTKAATAQYTYTFDGWATEANGAKVYNNGSTPTVSGTATYYAHFSSTVNSYSVTFKDNFGTTLKTQTVNYGSAATAPSIPEINCYTHGTWDKAYNNITGDLTVTVTYTIIPYTITATSDDDTQGTVAVTAL